MNKNFASLALLSLGLVACSRTADPIARHFALTPTVIISEILSDLPMTDNNNEFVELQCTPGASLASYWFVIVEGDINNSAPNDPGRVTFAKQLTGIACGSNGFVVLQRGGVYDGVVGATYADNFFTDELQNGSQTYMILDTAIAVDTDLDGTDNDGVINDTTLASHIIDSVAMLDGTVGDRAYSPAVLNAADNTAAIARFAGTTDSSTVSWFWGDAIDRMAGSGTDFGYGTSVSGNFPTGAELTPGEGNSVSPTLDLLPGPPVDLAGVLPDLTTTPVADLTGVEQDLTTGKQQDLTEQDLTGVEQDLTGVEQDLTGGPVDEDLATPEELPDLKKAADLKKPADAAGNEDGGTASDDLSTGGGRDRDAGCSCDTTGTPSNGGFGLILGLVALASVQRRRKPQLVRR